VAVAAVYAVGVYGTDLYDEIVVVDNPPRLCRERPPLRQHIDLITPSGRHYRWGEDEPNPEYVFADLRHSSTMPGGFETCEVTLPRKPGVDYSDLERLSTLRVMGTGGQVDGEYRLERAPRVSGDQMAISPSAVGWQAHLEDDKSARAVYVDRDAGRWLQPGTQRLLALATAGISVGSTGVSNDLSEAAVGLSYQGPWVAAAGIVMEATYLAPAGVDIDLVFADWEFNGNINPADANWQALAFSTTDGTDFNDSSGDFLSAATGELVYNPSTPRRGAILQVKYVAGPSGTDGTDYQAFFKSPAAYGDHGITRREVFGEPYGVLASDVVRHAVQTWAPLLQVKSDSIQASGFIVPHLVFYDPTTAAEIVRQASRFNLPDWAVWDDREFVWHERGARGKAWRARIGPSQLEETGPQLDRLWNGILVSYQDVDGSTRTVGPTGSGADTESVDLLDFDPENPANKLGIRRWELLQMGTSTAAGATEVGRRFLEQTKLLDSSGRCQIVGWIEDDRGVAHPYSRVRAGDTISFVDASDSSPRRIVKVDHTRSTRSCSIELDAPPQGLQELLERLSVVLVPLGV
jgi:hypothetical protein